MAVVGAAVLRPVEPALANAPAPSGPMPAPAPSQANDPLEGMNRAMYAVQRGLERVIIRPVLFVILTIAPKPLETGLSNAFRNLGEPITAVNDLLQLKVGKAATATGRFVTNSTLGLLGLMDVASDHGLAYHASDFGQTMGHYGAPAGPYVFLPVLGPSNVRDIGGRFVDAAMDPIGRMRFDGDGTVSTGRVAMGAIDRTAAGFATEGTEADDDPYATVRASFVNGRQATIQNRSLDLARSFWVEDAGLEDETPPAPPSAFASVADSFFQPAR